MPSNFKHLTTERAVCETIQANGLNMSALEISRAVRDAEYRKRIAGVAGLKNFLRDMIELHKGK